MHGDGPSPPSLPPFIPMLTSLLFLLLLLPLSVNGAGTTECHHSIEGSCTVDAIFGFCYHNKNTGEFNCDDSGFCARKIQGTKQAGCYKDGNSTTNDHCCCNTGAGCSIGFGTFGKEKKTTTTCAYHIDIANGQTKMFKDCEDPFCYTYMSQDEELVTSVWSGCMATGIVRFNIAKNEDKLYKNNTKWEELQFLYDMPRCEDIVYIVSDEDYRNVTETGEVSMCVEIEYLDEETDMPMKKRMCCCKGRDKCNDDFAWSSPAITMDQVNANKKRRLEGASRVVDGTTQSTLILSTLSVLTLHFFH